MTKEFLNKFSIGDSVHVDARVVGVHITDGTEVTYTLDVTNLSGDTERVYDIPECFIAKVF